jgi:hypothetical protein
MSEPGDDGIGLKKLSFLLAGGPPEARIVAEVLAEHPREQHAMLRLLQTTGGNAYAQSVVAALGLGNRSNASASLQSPLPLVSEPDLKARADRMTAERLLTSKEFNAGDEALRALELLLDVPAAQRTKVIDGLDDKAFTNLLERIPDADRERFSVLVEASHKPERRLRLWAEFHKSRAENDLRARKGDIGPDVPVSHVQDEDGEIVDEIDYDEKRRVEASWTPGQRLNRAKHERREAAVEATKDEVDLETKRLLAKEKQGTLTLANVDEMRSRKDREYRVELDHNVSLTADVPLRENGQPVNWSVDELELVDLTLDRLPHAAEPQAFRRLHRTRTSHFMDGKGGEFQGDQISLTDWGATTGKGFRHGGDARENVSSELRHTYGDSITALEFVLTHEIGHNVADMNPTAMAKFQKAAGWRHANTEELRRDGIDEKGLETLEAQRLNPHGARKEVGSAGTTYSAIKNDTTFWAIDRTAIPSAKESASGADNADTWQYSRVNPSEHFAEVYAKAVHVPEKLYDELVVRPEMAARTARALVEAAQREIEDFSAEGSQQEMGPQRKLLEARLVELKRIAGRAELSMKQRADEFRIMRDDVFGTGKAVALATQRMKARQVDADKIREFEARAVRLSTPEQVSLLESEYVR